jgi:hypothetical protein
LLYRDRANAEHAAKLVLRRLHRSPPRSRIPTHRGGRCRPSRLSPSISPLAATGVAQPQEDRWGP